jgi:choline dehydrogenase
MYLRGHPRDYNAWAEAGNTGWSYQDVLPYFIKSEDNRQVREMDHGFHGVGGLLSVGQFPDRPPLAEALLEAAQELGYPTNVDLNGRSYTGFVLAQTTSRSLFRQTLLSTHYVRQIVKGPGQIPITGGAICSSTAYVTFLTEHGNEPELFNRCTSRLRPAQPRNRGSILSSVKRFFSLTHLPGGARAIVLA